MDIDGDGYLDILSGTYSRYEESMAGLFYVLRGKPDGAFQPAEVLKGTDGEPLIIPVKGEQNDIERICTRPFAVDWDGDGHLDLVVGNFAGTFYWFKGHGKGQFLPNAEQLKAGKQPLRIRGAHSDPFVIDWDGDGDQDILSGSTEGGVQWAENVAGKGKPPELLPFKPLIKPGKTVADGETLKEDQLVGPTKDTRVWVADVNGDGKLDLLVGDSVTLIEPAKGLSEEEFQKKKREWQEEVSKITKKMNEEKDDTERTKLSREFVELYQKSSAFMKQERTGFVWVYYRN